VILVKGIVYACGSNKNGNLGCGSKIEAKIPVKVIETDGLKICKIFAGRFSGAIDDRGDIRIWKGRATGLISPEYFPKRVEALEDNILVMDSKRKVHQLEIIEGIGVKLQIETYIISPNPVTDFDVSQDKAYIISTTPNPISSLLEKGLRKERRSTSDFNNKSQIARETKVVDFVEKSFGTTPRLHAIEKRVNQFPCSRTRPKASSFSGLDEEDIQINNFTSTVKSSGNSASYYQTTISKLRQEREELIEKNKILEDRSRTDESRLREVEELKEGYSFLEKKLGEYTTQISLFADKNKNLQLENQRLDQESLRVKQEIDEITGRYEQQLKTLEDQNLRLRSESSQFIADKNDAFSEAERSRCEVTLKNKEIMEQSRRILALETQVSEEIRKNKEVFHMLMFSCRG